jgi:hypothetical protein
MEKLPEEQNILAEIGHGIFIFMCLVSKQHHMLSASSGNGNIVDAQELVEF